MLRSTTKQSLSFCFSGIGVVRQSLLSLIANLSGSVPAVAKSLASSSNGYELCTRPQLLHLNQLTTELFGAGSTATNDPLVTLVVQNILNFFNTVGLSQNLGMAREPPGKPQP